ncbi:hypothetical protein GCM10017673_35070 [Streptosporangium violaceochromogenes]|nr:hypothetical protein GCM10017673_35070 [Streptosporangium violaceochromogenes]
MSVETGDDPPEVFCRVKRSKGARTPFTTMTTINAQSTARPTQTSHRPPPPDQRIRDDAPRPRAGARSAPGS